MARRNRDEDYDYEYEYEDEEQDGYEEERRGLGSKAVFLLILGGLLLALTVLCVLLTGKLRSANKEVLALRSELEAAKSVTWTTPQEVSQPLVPTETVPIPTPGEAVSLPESTTPPESAPSPTPSAAPIVTAGALPSWITEADMANITRRPQDDEWYGAPGKLYVTASLGLNLRSGLRTDINNIVTQIKCGSEVEVYAASGNMRFVQDPKGNFGWCSNNLLSNEPPAGVDIIPFTKTPVQTPTPVSTAPEQSDVPVPEVPTING